MAFECQRFLNKLQSLVKVYRIFRAYLKIKAFSSERNFTFKKKKAGLCDEIKKAF